MTIKDLKETLEAILENLEENYEDGEEVNLVSNTYFLRGKYRFIALGSRGFVDLDYPTNEDEDGEE